MNDDDEPVIPLPAGTTVEFLSPNLARLAIPLHEPCIPESLTAAEQVIARYLYEGETNADIARHRGVSLRTINKQVEAIFEKLRVSSRAELVLSMLRPPE